jgi:putative transposase
MVSPARRRDAVKYLCRRHPVSERRACRLLGQHRSTQRYLGVPKDHELRLVASMNRLAEAHPRYGCRRIWPLLRSEGWRINRKRIERLWRLEGHRVPPRRAKDSGHRAQGEALNAPWNLPATQTGPPPGS